MERSHLSLVCILITTYEQANKLKNLFSVFEYSNASTFNN